MNEFDYDASAELFLRNIGARGKHLAYKRFNSAAEAIRYVIEGNGATGFAATTLEVEGDRYEKPDIQRLYDAVDYPLARNVPLAA